MYDLGSGSIFYMKRLAIDPRGPLTLADENMAKRPHALISPKMNRAWWIVV